MLLLLPLKCFIKCSHRGYARAPFLVQFKNKATESQNLIVTFLVISQIFITISLFLPRKIQELVVVEVSSKVAFSIEAFVTNVTNETFQRNTIFVSDMFSFVSYKIAWIG